MGEVVRNGMVMMAWGWGRLCVILVAEVVDVWCYMVVKADEGCWVNRILGEWVILGDGESL